MIDLSHTQRIAIFRALQLGDLLQAVPALRALRAGFPNAEITLIGLPWARSFVQRFQHYIDRFVEFVGFPGIAEVEVIPEQTDRFIKEQRDYGYDLAVQMHGSGKTSNRFVCSLGANMTVGYYPVATPLVGVPYQTRHLQGASLPGSGKEDGTPTRGVATEILTLGVPYPNTEPEVYRNLGLARLLGCPNDDPTLEFPLDASDYAEAAALLHGMPGMATVRSMTGAWDMATARVATTIHENEHRTEYSSGDPCGRHASHGRHAPHKRLAKKSGTIRPRIGLHPGARPPSRRWPAAYFASVGDELVRRFDAQVILTGSTDELKIVRSVEEQMTTQPINLAGKTSLGGLAALIDTLDLFISNDTGPAHIANALNTPSITIFGPAEYRRWAPLNQHLHRVARHPVACSPCGYWDCPIDHRCLRRLSPHTILAAAGDLLEKGAVV